MRPMMFVNVLANYGEALRMPTPDGFERIMPLAQHHFFPPELLHDGDYLEALSRPEMVRHMLDRVDRCLGGERWIPADYAGPLFLQPDERIGYHAQGENKAAYLAMHALWQRRILRHCPKISRVYVYDVPAFDAYSSTKTFSLYPYLPISPRRRPNAWLLSECRQEFNRRVSSRRPVGPDDCVVISPLFYNEATPELNRSLVDDAAVMAALDVAIAHNLGVIVWTEALPGEWEKVIHVCELTRKYLAANG